MRIILVFLIGCFITLPAYAYIEDRQRDETAVTAGDQNSSMHRLTEKNTYLIKKLKQADEYITRKRASGRAVNAEDLDGLLLSEKEDKARLDLKQTFLNVEMRARSPRQLVVPADHTIYAELFKMQRAQIKDARIVYELKQQRRLEK